MCLAVASCAAETKFISNVQAYLLTEDALYAALTHDGQTYTVGGQTFPGTFRADRECVAECPRGNCKPDKDDRACCGVMPERFPFKLYTGLAEEQACCGGANVYSVVTHNCVANEVVKK